MSKNKKDSRCKAILRRGGDMLLMALLAISLFILIFPAYNLFVQSIYRYLDHFHEYFRYVIVAIFVILLFWSLSRIGGFRWKDFIWWRMPIWRLGIIAGVLCPLILWVVIPERGASFNLSWANIILMAIVSPDLTISYFLLILAFVIWPLGIVGYAVSAIQKARSRKVKDHTALAQKQLDPENFEELISWIEVEEPIDKPTEDRFDMAPIPRRIARILREKRLKTIGLIGPYGCGKSSVLKMAEYHLKRAPHEKGLFPAHKIVICKVDGWGLNREHTAEYILQKSITKLSRYVDCLGLMDIPREYYEALSNAGPWWCKYLAIGFQKKDAIEQLKKIDNVLLSVGMRLIVFIEDVDRNIQKVDTHHELAALLDRLKDLQNLSFVLAINPNVDMADSGISLRVAEHIETVPSLPPKKVREILKTFRNKCRTRYQKEDIDSTTEEDHKKRWGTDEFGGIVDADDWDAYTGDRSHPLFAIPKLLVGPRMLKHALRRTWLGWQYLHGEIDFDDLLMVNVLRFAAPETFDFIHNHIYKLRQAESGKNPSATENKSKEDEKPSIRALWVEHTQKVSWDTKAAYNLLRSLFPGIEDWGHNEMLGSQCIGRNSMPVDYWKRLNAEELDRYEIQDQTVLHAIEKWKKNSGISEKIYQGYTLAEAMLNFESFAERIEQFGCLLNRDNLIILAQQYFDLIREKEKEKAIALDSWYQGYFNFQRMIKGYRGEFNGDWIIDEMEKMLPINLRLVMDLYKDFYKSFYPSGLTQEHRVSLVNSARKTYKDIELFANIVEETESGCLIKFINILNVHRENEKIDYSQSKWLGELLLEAVQKQKYSILPNFMHIVIEQKEYDGGWKDDGLRNDESSLWSMFEGGKKKVLIVMANIDIALINNLDNTDRDRIQYAWKEAKKWLEEHRMNN